MADATNHPEIKLFMFPKGLIKIGWIVIPEELKPTQLFYYDNNPYEHIEWVSPIRYATFGFSSTKVVLRMIKWLKKEGYVDD